MAGKNDRKDQEFNKFNFDGCYGKQVTQHKAKEFLLATLQDNCRMEERGLPRSVCNIWGPAGTSKTSVVKSLKGHMFKYKGVEKPIQIIDIPIAQNEEMGDILGVPETFYPIEKVEISHDKDGKEIRKVVDTKKVICENAVLDLYFKLGYTPVEGARSEMGYAPPAWVPTNEGPGIIIFDDANRASIRILKGIMQLIQDYRTIGWAIPPGWMIVCTGNPDNASYIVAAQDDAMITRQRHITMNPSVEQWAEWAREVGIDDRGVSFLLKNPEMIYPRKNADGNTSSRTNFRTIASFFLCLDRYGKIDEKNRGDFYMDGQACVDEEFVNQFFLFLTRDYSLTLDPMDILEHPNDVHKEIEKWMKGTEVRIDMLNITIERLIHFLNKAEYKVSPVHKENICKFLLNPLIPQSMVHAMLRRINNISHNGVNSYIKGNEPLKQLVMQMVRLDGVIK